MPTNSWNEGYMTEVEYTHGCYRELSPTLQRFSLICAGFAPPQLRTYLELGCGQGLAACIHAAATDGEVWATDFNPSQALHAMDLLQAADIPGHISDASFTELLASGDLPACSHVSAHGIWAWVSAENRAVIVEILRQHLAVGGVAYLCYNALPGWSSAWPMRDLMQLHAELTGAPGDGALRHMQEAIAFVRRLAKAGSLYFMKYQDLLDRLDELEKVDPRYVVHEYFNASWTPMHFADVAKALAGAKLDFAASVHMLDQVDPLNFTPEAQAMIEACGHPILRETIRDFLVSRFFRRDLFLRGSRRLSEVERNRLLADTRIAAMVPPERLTLVLTGPVGKVSLQEAIYRPLLEALCGDGFRPKSLAELQGLLPSMSLLQLIEAVKVLVGTGHASPCQDAAAADTVAARSARLNREICRRAQFSGVIGYLASPELGTGFQVSRIEQLFLLSIDAGGTSAEDWARFAWSVFDGEDLRVEKSRSPANNLAEFVAAARSFAVNRLPLLKALRIA